MEKELAWAKQTVVLEGRSMLGNHWALVRVLPMVPLLCGLAFGQFPANNTTPYGQANGRFWRSLGSSTSRAIYLAGYFHGFDQALVEMLDGTNDDQVLNAQHDIPKATTGETADALDKFYEDPENLNIPIWRAIRIAALKIAGRPRGEIDAEMDTARSARQAISLPFNAMVSMVAIC